MSLNKTKKNPNDLDLEQWSENTQQTKHRIEKPKQPTVVPDPWKFTQTKGFNNKLKKNLKTFKENQTGTKAVEKQTIQVKENKVEIVPVTSLTDEPSLEESAIETEASVNDQFGPQGILKPQTLKNTEGGITISRIDKKKLDQLMGGQINAQQFIKLQLEVDKNKRIRNGEDVKDIDELINAGFINEKFEKAIKKGRQVLASDVSLVEWDEKQMDHHECELSNFGSKLQMRYVEHWINEVLTECEELAVPGILQAPEQKRPLFRYEVDRQQLYGLGLASDGVDHIYRTLYTHSVGLFNTLREITRHMKEGRAVVLSNIWRIYQVLLEHASKNDYKLITQVMTEQYAKDKVDLQNQIDILNASIIQKDIALQEKIQKLNHDYDKLEQDQRRFEGERQKLFDELKKSQQRLEEEVNLRLFFENKLNQLHAVNNHSESNAKLLFEQRANLISEISQLKKENIEIIQENVQYKKVKEHLEDKFTAVSQEAKILKEVSGNQTTTIGGLRTTLELKQKVNDHVSQKLEKAEKDIFEKDQEEARMKNTVMSSAQFVESLQGLYKEQKRQNLELEERIAQLNQQVKDGQACLDKEAAEHQAVSAENELNKTRLDHAMLKITQLTKKEEGWETKCQALGAQYEHLEQSYEISKQHLRKSNQRIEELEFTRNELKEQLQKIMGKSGQLEKDRRVLSSLYTKCKQESFKMWVERNDIGEELQIIENDRDTFKTKCNEFRQSDITNSETLKQRQILMEENLRNQSQKCLDAQYQKGFLAQRNKELEQQMIDWKHQLNQNNIKIEYLELELQEQRGLHEKFLIKFSTKINSDELATDTYSLTEQVKYLNLRNKEESKIYQDKISKMKFEFDRLGMQIEDGVARNIRSEQTNRLKTQQIQKLQAELSFIGRRYISCLVTRHIGNTRLQKQKGEVKRLNELMRTTEASMCQHKAQLEMLKQMKENIEKVAKDNSESPVETLMRLISDNEIQADKIESQDKRMTELDLEITRLQELYENKTFYEQSIQTDTVQFLTSEIMAKLGNLEMENTKLKHARDNSDFKHKHQPGHIHMNKFQKTQNQHSLSTSQESGVRAAQKEKEEEDRIRLAAQQEVKKKLKNYIGAKLKASKNRRQTVNNYKQGEPLIQYIGDHEYVVGDKIVEPDAEILQEAQMDIHYRSNTHGSKSSMGESNSIEPIPKAAKEQNKERTKVISPIMEQATESKQVNESTPEKKPEQIKQTAMIISEVQNVDADEEIQSQTKQNKNEDNELIVPQQNKRRLTNKNTDQLQVGMDENGCQYLAKIDGQTPLARATSIVQNLLHAEAHPECSKQEAYTSSASKSSKDQEPERIKPKTHYEEPAFGEIVGVGALTTSKTTMAEEHELVAIEKSSSCTSENEEQSCGEDSGSLDNDMFIEYVRNCDANQVKQLVEQLNAEPRVNNSLGVCPRCSSKLTNKVFVRIKANRPPQHLRVVPSSQKLEGSHNGELFKKQLQRMFQNRSASPMPDIRNRKATTQVSQTKSSKNQLRTLQSTYNSQLLPSHGGYTSTSQNPQSTSDLKQYNYNIDDFLKHYKGSTIDLNNGNPSRTQTNFFKQGNLLATMGNPAALSNVLHGDTRGWGPRAQTQNQKQRPAKVRNMFNRNGDDMSINQWNESPIGLPGGSESPQTISQIGRTRKIPQALGPVAKQKTRNQQVQILNTYTYNKQGVGIEL